MVEVNLRRIAESFVSEGYCTIERALAITGQKSPWISFEAGKLSAESLSQWCISQLGSPMTMESFTHCVNAVLGKPIDETHALISQLRAAGNVRLACLSNTNVLHWPELFRTVPAMQLFEVTMASQILGCCKPDREIYDRALGELNATASECVLIDDRLDNVEGARAAGWHAIHYTGDTALRRELQELGVLRMAGP